MKKTMLAICLGLSLALVEPVMTPAIGDVTVNAEAAANPKLSQKKVTVYVGRKMTIKVKNGRIKWAKSSKKTIAKVKKKGKKKFIITGKKAGSATIKVKLTTGRTLKCKVKVKRRRKGNKVIFAEQNRYSLQGSYAAIPFIYYGKFDEDKVTFNSSNDDIATLNDYGRGSKENEYICYLLLNDEQTGIANITLTDDKSDESIKIQVNVKDNKTLWIEDTTNEIYDDEAGYITTSIYPGESFDLVVTDTDVSQIQKFYSRELTVEELPAPSNSQKAYRISLPKNYTPGKKEFHFAVINRATNDSAFLYLEFEGTREDDSVEVQLKN